MSPQRPLFWSVEGAWLFYVLAAAAMAVFAYGVTKRARVWWRGSRQHTPGSTRAAATQLLLDGVLGRRLFRGELAAGLMHGLIFWGFAGLTVATTLAAVDHYLVSFLDGRVYLVFSLGAEVAGVMLLAGLGWALVRRYAQRVSRLEQRGGDLLVLLWLTAATLSGFVLEGLRLAVQQPEWASWSFGGMVVSGLWQDPAAAQAAYPACWWIHVLLSLSLLAAVPYTKLLHVVAAPASIYLERSSADDGATPAPAEDDPAATDEPTGGAPPDSPAPSAAVFSFRERVFLDACTQCGRCVEACPSARAGEPLSPRALIAARRAQLWSGPDPAGPQSATEDPSTETPTGEVAWHCTTCGACLEVCPAYVATPQTVIATRRELIERGTEVPAPLTAALDKLYKYGNPWEASKKKRTKWAADLSIPDLSRKGTEEPLCYFVGCTTAFDTRANGLARSLVEVLRHAGVAFGTLGKKEACCGDIARRVGEQGLYEEQRERCLSVFERYEVADVITSSPHCFDTLRHATASLGDAQVRHYTQLLAKLLDQGKLRLARPVEAKVTFHDPCYLGRYGDIYDPPRRLLRAIDGLELVEMAHHGRDSHCCGGGGGRMWQPEELNGPVMMSELRIQEAADTGASIVATACPLCLIMLDDARKTAGLEDRLEIKDLSELVAAAVERRRT